MGSEALNQSVGGAVELRRVRFTGGPLPLGTRPRFASIFLEGTNAVEPPKSERRTVVAKNEPSEDMNKIIREQISRRRERAPLLWPAEPRDNDDDQEDEQDAGN